MLRRHLCVQESTAKLLMSFILNGLMDSRDYVSIKTLSLCGWRIPLSSQLHCKPSPVHLLETGKRSDWKGGITRAIAISLWGEKGEGGSVCVLCWWRQAVPVHKRTVGVQKGINQCVNKAGESRQTYYHCRFYKNMCWPIVKKNCCSIVWKD